MIKKKKDPRKTDADAKKGGAEIAYLRQRLRTKCNEPPNIMTCAFMVASKSNLCEISRADHLQQIMQNNSTIITFETQKQITIVWKKKKSPVDFVYFLQPGTKHLPQNKFTFSAPISVRPCTSRHSTKGEMDFCKISISCTHH